MDFHLIMTDLKVKYTAASEWIDGHIPSLQPKDLGFLWGLNMQITHNGEFKSKYLLETGTAFYDWHEKAKYQSWKDASNMTVMEAMQAYVSKVDKIKRENAADFDPTEDEKEMMQACNKKNNNECKLQFKTKKN